MSTPATTPASSGINWATVTPVIEGFANLALVGLQAGGVVPVGSSQIAAVLEQSINNLIAQQQSPSTSTDQTVLNAYAVLIAGFKAYQIASANNSALVKKIGVYLDATEAGLAGYVQAGAGFDPANYQPIPPVQ